MSWEVENIPDEAELFYRVHYNFTDKEGKLIPGAFRNSPKNNPTAGMSVNWEKYANAQETQSGAGEGKPPENYAVVKLIAGRVRSLSLQSVEHDPTEENRAHSQVYGDKTVEVRAKLMGMYEPVLPFDPKHKQK